MLQAWLELFSGRRGKVKRFTLSLTLPSPEASPSKKDLKGEGIKRKSALRQAQDRLANAFVVSLHRSW